eukprot:418203_1
MCIYVFITLFIFPTYFVIFQCIASCCIDQMPNALMEENEDIPCSVSLKSQISALKSKSLLTKNDWDLLIKYDIAKQPNTFSDLVQQSKSSMATESSRNCLSHMKCGSCVRIGYLLRLFQETIHNKMLFINRFCQSENKYDIDSLICDYLHIEKYHSEHLQNYSMIDAVNSTRRIRLQSLALTNLELYATQEQAQLLLSLINSSPLNRESILHSQTTLSHQQEKVAKMIMNDEFEPSIMLQALQMNDTCLQVLQDTETTLKTDIEKRPFDIFCDRIKCPSFMRNSRFRNRIKNDGLNSVDKQSELQDWMDVIHSFCVHNGNNETQSKNAQFVTFIEDKQNSKSDEQKVNVEHTDEEEDNTAAAKYYFGINFVYHKPSNSTEKRYCIKPKCVSLREELHENKLCEIKTSEWEYAYKKANRLIKTFPAKNTKAKRFGVLNEKMNITENNPLRINHLLAMVFYCDFDELCLQFRKTYRSINRTETIKEIKKRHCVFGNWGKLLFEVVKLYGDPASTHKTYYHGLNTSFLFAKFLVFFASPLSTSTNSVVANNFATINGIIIALQPQVGYTSFDVSWCSRFGQENETLFFGIECLIENIIFDGLFNHKCEMKALLLMQQLLNGEIITNKCIDDEDCQNKLLKFFKEFMREHEQNNESNYFMK